MSKVVKDLMIRDYKQRLNHHSEALVISVRGMPAFDNNKLRNELAKKQIRITVVRNDLVRHAISGTALEGIDPLLKGPTALAYGGESVVDVAREIMKWAQQLQQLELRGAILDGVLFDGKAGVERLSKFPTRDEAHAQNVTLILSPGRKLLGAVKGPGSRLLGIVKAIEEKLEKGEAIAAVA